ncbi:hypothetical protein [Neisseria sp. MVDL20-010259]|nr:hypothetical protein [Neisseria sp. MVDL20-010259]MDO1563133.1 hypothetical protein [Neisseria sp. MVDL20-010259]
MENKRAVHSFQTACVVKGRLKNRIWCICFKETDSWEKSDADENLI